MSKLDKKKIVHVFIVFILRINTIYYTLITGRVWKPKTAGEQEGERVRLVSQERSKIIKYYQRPTNI